jgi:hypothetical protein
MAFGDFTWIATFTGNVIAEGIAGGGAGRIGQNPQSGPGGGGGAYARTAGIPVAVGIPYLVRVGGPINIPSNHESLFPGTALMYAREATSAGFLTPGVGGSAALCTGDVKHSGGNGGPWLGNGTPGSGGGSSATRDFDGVDGVTTPGGIAVPAGFGGNGGDGGAFDADGMNAQSPGGGGGGGGAATIQTNPGGGGEGCVVLWQDLGVWPPPAYSFLGAWGSPPAAWIDKVRKVSFMM